MLTIETDHNVYHVKFGQIQIEITNVCNMQCAHCRVTDDRHLKLSAKNVIKIVDFAIRHASKDLCVVISGGEPLLHPEIKEILRGLSTSGVKRLALTTNGSFLAEALLNYINDLNFDKVTISVSLDGTSDIVHNAVRGVDFAFEHAVNAL